MALLVWLASLGSVLLVGFAFGAVFGRERERRRHPVRKRTCRTCDGWGRIPTGSLPAGVSCPDSCPDCEGRGYIREAV